MLKNTKASGTLTGGNAVASRAEMDQKWMTEHSGKAFFQMDPRRSDVAVGDRVGLDK